MSKRSFIREILESIDKETISFAGGLPDEDLFPIEDLADAANKVLRDKKHFQYTISNGIEPLRQKIAQFYCDEGFDTKAQNILITTGSQQALYIISKYFENKDILIEKPSYLGAVNIFKMNNMPMTSAMLNHDGIEIDEFKKEYEKAKLAYLIPDYQNPRASLYTNEKREEIASIVRSKGGYIIEDAPYRELYFSKSMKSISSMIPENSFHLGSFSKALSPSFRLGWLRASEEMILKLTQIKETIDLHSSGITQYIINEYLNDTSRFEEHLKVLRKNYKEKMEFFADALNEILPSFEFERPDGGMFIYGRLPKIDTKKLVYKALDQKVVYVPGMEFYIDGGGEDEIRFNFTHSSKDEIKEGLKRLKSII